MPRNTSKFSKQESKEILKRARRIVYSGYSTGFNYIWSRQKLPREGIVIHFLQDSGHHIHYVRSKLAVPSLVVPRIAFYLFDPSYFDKSGFEDEYRKAEFYDSEFHKISLRRAKRVRRKITISNRELDLMVPLTHESLEKTVETLQKADKTGPKTWRDPFVIIRLGRRNIGNLPGFVSSTYYVNIRREREEFYTLVPSKRRSLALRRYVKRLCERVHVGELDENSVVFEPSQINKEAFDYMARQIRPLRQLG